MTQTAQHTPGPWEAIPTVHSQAFSIFGRKENAEYHVGTLTGGSKTELQVLKANVRLIAAAPDMLEALEFVRMTFADIEASKRKGYTAECPKIVDAAIAKAESEASGGTTRIAKKPKSRRNPKNLPPDPENMNDDRAEWAASALRQFQCVIGTDDDDALGDLLADLMHWCDRNYANFEAALARARMHYEAETTAAETTA